MKHNIIIPKIQDPALKDFQLEAVKDATQKLNRKHGVLLHGTTGAGKTAIALSIARTRKQKDKFTITLVLVPSISGNLPKQWMTESVRWGIPSENTFLFHGKDRDNFSVFIRQHEDTSNQMLLCITTPETCVSELKKKSTTFCNMHWTYVISDEAHMWRNGTNKMKEEIVDPDKKRYSLITNRIIKHTNPNKPYPLVMLLTATPYKNNYMDYFPYMHWLSPRQPDKKKWLNGRKKDQPSEYKLFLQEKDPLLEKHIVHIKPPKMPLPTVHMIEHNPGKAEYDALILTHIKVNKASHVYMKAISAYSTARSSINYERMQAAHVAWVSALTRAKRQTLHPGFKEVALPVLGREHIDSEVLVISKQKIMISDGENAKEIACDFRLTEEENKQKIVNLHGFIRWVEYDERVEVQMPRIKGNVEIESGNERHLIPNPFEQLDWKKYKQEWPLAECSRFKATIDIIKQLEGKKIMLVSYYKQPLQLLAEYIYDEVPTATLLQHYGGRNNSDLIEQFHEASDSKTTILIATRSSISEGVDVTCCNHMICLDPASNFADDKQMKGRMIRPYARLFSEYNTYDFTLNCSGQSGFVDNWVIEMQKIKGGEAAQFISNEDGDELMHEEESSNSTVQISSLQLLISMLTNLSDDFCNGSDDQFESLTSIQAKENKKRKAEHDNEINKKQKIETTPEDQAQGISDEQTRTDRLIHACDGKNKYEYNQNLEMIKCAARAAYRRRGV